MTPEESISIAFRAASREMARGMLPAKAAAYQGFLVQTRNTLDGAAKAITTVAKSRPTSTPDEAAAFEMDAYKEILQATISCLMALGHFPYGEKVDSSMIQEKLS